MSTSNSEAAGFLCGRICIFTLIRVAICIFTLIRVANCHSNSKLMKRLVLPNESPLQLVERPSGCRLLHKLTIDLMRRVTSQKLKRFFF